jgi:hypothetical protein
VLRLSEHAAYGRIEAARAARRCPGILDLLAKGTIKSTRSLPPADCDLTAALLGAGWQRRAMWELREPQSFVVRGWFTLLSDDARAGAQTSPDLLFAQLSKTKSQPDT